jgi:branched-subunit amino acid transport protein
MTLEHGLLVIGMALVTFGVRYPVMLLVGRLPLPQSVFKALRYVPLAVLAAIITPAVLMPNGEIDLSLNNSYLLAGIISVVIAWRTKNLLLTILVGMGALLVLRAIF